MFKMHLKCNNFSCRCICFRAKLLSQRLRLEIPQRFCFTSSRVNLDVEIPKRIERGPTDVLKALSLTVSKDPTAFHYKYPDDPFFYTYSNPLKRKLALSLESGRKSARWITRNHPEYFNNKLADPIIQAFINKPDYSEDPEQLEVMIISAIKQRNVEDAIRLYSVSKEKNVDLSKNTKQLLLELVCFYNCGEKKKEEELEIKWFQINIEKLKVKTWLDQGFAEKLFESMDANCPLACAAIIRGRLKYNQVEAAFELFNALREKGMVFPVGVYNDFLLNVNNLAENNDNRWKLIEEWLSEMERNNIKPNLNTLNSILESLQNTKNWLPCKNYAVKTIEEFKKVDVAPSLGTYYHLLSILSRYKAELSFTTAILNNILVELSGEKLKVRHSSDFLFFPFVMNLCSEVFKSSRLANLLNRLLWKNDNLKFIRANFDESYYYKNYFTVIFRGESIDDAMKMYLLMVPTVYSPEVAVFSTILEAVKKHKGFKYLPKIWEDLKQQKYSEVLILLSKLLSMVNLHQGKEIDEVVKVFHEAAVFTERVLLKDQESGSVRNPEFVHVLVENMFVAYIKNEDEYAATRIFNLVNSDSYEFGFEPHLIKIFYDFCLSKKNFSVLLDCLRYSSSRKHKEVIAMAKDALPHLSAFSEVDSKWVRNLANETEEKKPEISEKQETIN